MGAPLIWAGASAKLLKDSLLNSTGQQIAGLAVEQKNANFTAVARNSYLVDTSAGAVTVTLPAGQAGTTIRVTDSKGTWNTNNCTITPASGQKITGLANDETLVCDINGAFVELTWDVTNSHWSLASGGTNTAAAETFYSNNSTGATSDSSSYVTGSAGSAFPNSNPAATIYKEVDVGTVTATDRLITEVSFDRVIWTHPGTQFANGTGIDLFRTESGGTYGVSHPQQTGTAGKARVYIGIRMNPSGASWGNGYYWRVRKITGNSVSFPEVVPGTSAGIVAAQGLKGQPGTSAVAAGYVGEVINGVTNNGSLTTGTRRGVATISVPSAGIWMIVANLQVSSSPTGHTRTLMEIAADAVGGTAYAVFDTPTGPNAAANISAVLTTVQRVTGATSFSCNCYAAFTGGSAAGTALSSFAVRIA